MTLSITNTLITSDVTHHTAALIAAGEPDGWEVSWQRGTPLTREQAVAAIELAEIVSRGRDGGPDTTNYAYLTWERVKELAEVLRVIPLKTVLYLESLARSAEGPERSDPEKEN